MKENIPKKNNAYKISPFHLMWIIDYIIRDDKFMHQNTDVPFEILSESLLQKLLIPDRIFALPAENDEVVLCV